MAINYPGPYQVRVFYTVNSIDHQFNLNVDLQADPTVGDTFDTIVANRRNGATEALDSSVDTIVGLVLPFYKSTEASFDRAELWKFTPLTFQSSYVSTYDISLPGTGTGTTEVAGQARFAFRTQEGGIMFFDLMESQIPAGDSLAYAAMTASEQALVDEFTINTNVWLARDTSYPIAFIKLHPGRNEALFKKRYRN